jgi:ketosteroid isomerase-like protein
MGAEDIRRLVQASYDAYARGDRAFAADMLDNDIEWTTMFAPSEALPVPNRLHGKAEVLAALKQIDEAVELVRNEIVLLMVDGDRAAVICDRTVRQRSTGRVLRYKVAAFHRFRDGRLIEYQAFSDSFDLLQQALGRVFEVPAAYPR